MLDDNDAVLVYARMWEVVPAARPVSTADSLQFRLIDGSLPAMCLLYGGKVIVLPRSQLLLACRVAAEDWLMAQQFDLVVSHVKGRWSVGQKFGEQQACYNMSAAGHPTIHHALVAACLAIVAATIPD